MWATAFLLLQQHAAIAIGTSPTTPPSRDTIGYWQQSVRYEIHATLDERASALHGVAAVVYTNHSPDTLRELYVHQHLNALRPGSRWSAIDEREYRQRFQRLPDPLYGYERFTAVPTIDGRAIAPEYPGAPDSTVVHFVLPRPLPPGDSLRLHFEWDARPPTVPRRNARRGRQYDFAQWFPKIAVYDRGGWEPFAMIPNGELYGEFGSYDVTLVVNDDQVIGATGSLMSGDPGWSRVLRGGAVRWPSDRERASLRTTTMLPAVRVPDGMKAVRFAARDVHHFAFTVNPEYRYEGGVFVRPRDGATARFTPWDTVAIHVLYKPGDDTSWGGGKAVDRTRAALAWLDSTYGPYAYPQMTVTHRLDTGATEFPMLIMNQTSSFGLILHEGGHNYTYGILANNEWKSAWMDEGLTDYQTQWAQRIARIDRGVTGKLNAPPRDSGYHARAKRPSRDETTDLTRYRYDLLGRAEPIGTRADQFNEFDIYNGMVYARAAQMYNSMRDMMGDTAFRAFLRTYYRRWQLRHVDEEAMRASAEEITGTDLRWFFNQWVHNTGLIDYALKDVQIGKDSVGGWMTLARVERVGEYRHPVPVGVRTAEGWTEVHARAEPKDQVVEIHTASKPIAVRIDPLEKINDWNRLNDARRGDLPRPAYVFDWPFLDQWQSDRRLVAITPLAWNSRPGGATLGLRSRSNYQRDFDKRELGLVVSAYVPARALDAGGREVASKLSAVQGWAVLENPLLPGASRPWIGVRAGAWALDGVAMISFQKSWDDSPFLVAKGPQRTHWVRFTGTFPYSSLWLDSLRWSGASVTDITLGAQETRVWRAMQVGWRASASAGGMTAPLGSPSPVSKRGYGSVIGEARLSRAISAHVTGLVRGYAAVAPRAPAERAIYLSSRNPTESFEQHWWRPRGGLLSDPSVHGRPIGGAGLRGYSPFATTPRVVAANGELAYELIRTSTILHDANAPVLSVVGFGDAAYVPMTVSSSRGLGDAGVGLVLRGPLYDRSIGLRFDVPLFVSEPALAVGVSSSLEKTQWRWAVSVGDLW